MTRQVWILAVFLTFFVGLAQPGPKTCAEFFADVGGIEVADFPQARGVTLADLVTVLTALDPGIVPATLMFAEPPARYNPDEHIGIVCTDDYLFVFVNDPFGLRIYNLSTQTSVTAKIMGVPAHAQPLRQGIYLVEVFVNGDRGTGVVDVNTGEILLSLVPGGFSSYPTVLVDGDKFLVQTDSWGAPSAWGSVSLVLYGLSPQIDKNAEAALTELASCHHKFPPISSPGGGLLYRISDNYTILKNELFVVDEDGADPRLLPQCRAVAEQMSN